MQTYVRVCAGLLMGSTVKHVYDPYTCLHDCACVLCLCTVYVRISIVLICMQAYVIKKCYKFVE